MPLSYKTEIRVGPGYRLRDSGMTVEGKGKSQVATLPPLAQFLHKHAENILIVAAGSAKADATRAVMKNLALKSKRSLPARLLNDGWWLVERLPDALPQKPKPHLCQAAKILPFKKRDLT